MTKAPLEEITFMGMRVWARRIPLQEQKLAEQYQEVSGLSLASRLKIFGLCYLAENMDNLHDFAEGSRSLSPVELTWLDAMLPGRVRIFERSDARKAYSINMAIAYVSGVLQARRELAEHDRLTHK